MFLPCRPCCGAGACQCAGGLPTVDPADFGAMTATGDWEAGVDFRYGAGTGGKTYYFYGSECTSKAGGNASVAEQQDWGNLCNWYTDIERSPYDSYLAVIPFGELTGKASSLPPTDAVVHILSPVSTATSGAKTVATAYFWASLEGGTVTATVNAYDSPHPCLFYADTSPYSYSEYPDRPGNKGTVYGGAKFIDYAGNHGTIASGGGTFIQGSFSSGDITGDSAFYDNSKCISGTVTGNATFYDNSEASPYHSALSLACTITGNVVADYNSLILGSSATGVFTQVGGTYTGLGASNGYAEVTGNITLYDSADFLDGSTQGNLVAWDYSGAACDVSGTTTMNDRSRIITAGQTCTGAVTMNNNSTVESSSFSSPPVYASAGITFYNNTRNTGIVTGNAVFNDASFNGYGYLYPGPGSINGSAVFNGTSSNSLTGDTTETTTFNDSSGNYGYACTLSGNAVFNDSSINGQYGSVGGFSGGGTATFNDAACSLRYAEPFATRQWCPPDYVRVLQWFIATSDPLKTIRGASSTAPAFCDPPPRPACGVR